MPLPDKDEVAGTQPVPKKQQTNTTDPYGYKRLGMSEGNINAWDKNQKASRFEIDRSQYSTDELADFDKKKASGYTDYDALNGVADGQALHVNTLVDKFVMLDSLNKEYVEVDPHNLEQLIANDTTIKSEGQRNPLFRAAAIIKDMQDSGFVIVKNKRDGRYWVERKDGGQGKNVINGIVEIATVLNRYAGKKPVVVPETVPEETPEDNPIKDDDKVLPENPAPNTPEEVEEIIANEDGWQEHDDYYVSALLTDMATSAIGVTAKTASLFTGPGAILGWLGGDAVSLSGGLTAAGLDAYGDYLNPNVDTKELLTNLGIRIGLEGTEMIAAAPISLAARFGKTGKALRLMKKLIDVGMLAGAVNEAQKVEWTELLAKDDWSIDDWRAVATMSTVLTGVAASGVAKVHTTRKVKKGNKQVATHAENFEGEVAAGMRKAKADGEIAGDFASGKKNKAKLDADTEAVFNKSKTKRNIEVNQKKNAKKAVLEVDDVLHANKKKAKYDTFGDVSNKNKAANKKGRLKEKALADVTTKRTETAKQRINKKVHADSAGDSAKNDMHRQNMSDFKAKKDKAKTKSSKDNWQRKIDAEKAELKAGQKNMAVTRNKGNADGKLIENKHRADLNKKINKQTSATQKEKRANLDKGKKDLDKKYTDIDKTKKAERKKIYDKHNETTKSSNKDKADFKDNVKKGQTRLQAKKKGQQAEGRAKKKVEIVKGQELKRRQAERGASKAAQEHNKSFRSEGHSSERKGSSGNTDRQTKAKINTMNERIAQIDVKLNNPKTKHTTSKKEIKALTKERADLQARSDRTFKELQGNIASAKVGKPAGKVEQAVRDIIKKVPGAKTVHKKLTTVKGKISNSKLVSKSAKVGKGARRAVQDTDELIFNNISGTAILRATQRGSGATNSDKSSKQDAREDLRGLGFKFKPGEISDEDALKLQNYYIKKGLIIKKGGKTLKSKQGADGTKKVKKASLGMLIDPIHPQVTENFGVELERLLVLGKFDEAQVLINEVDMDPAEKAVYYEQLATAYDSKQALVAKKDPPSAEVVGDLGQDINDIDKQIQDAVAAGDYAKATELAGGITDEAVRKTYTDKIAEVSGVPVKGADEVKNEDGTTTKTTTNDDGTTTVETFDNTGNSIKVEVLDNTGNIVKSPMILPDKIDDEGEFETPKSYGGLNALKYLKLSDIANFISPYKDKEFHYPVTKRQATVTQTAPVRDMAGLSLAMQRNMKMPATDSADAYQNTTLLARAYNSGIAENNKLVTSNAQFVNNQIDKRTLATNANNASIAQVNNDYSARLEAAAGDTAASRAANWKEGEERRNKTEGRIANAVGRTATGVWNASIDNKLINSKSAELAWDSKYKKNYDEAVRRDDKVLSKKYMDQYREKYDYDPTDFSTPRARLISRKVVV